MHSSTSRDGVTLSYRVFGAGQTTVILVHGWMLSGASYDELIEALEGPANADQRGDGASNARGSYRFVVVDLRGTGGSDKPERGYTIAQYAEDVLAVADAVGARSFVVVGHSMGGKIAQWLAATAPERVLGAVLLCPVPASPLRLRPETREVLRGSAGDRNAQAQFLITASKVLPEAALARCLDEAAKIPAACIQQALDAWADEGFADKLGAIRAPVLVVGTDDPYLPVGLLQAKIVNAIPTAALAYLPGVGHNVQMERPRETAAVLRAFLCGLNR